jgi:lactose/L-arabinose transport system permease protein
LRRRAQLGKRQRLWHELVRARWAYVFIAPFFLGFIIFSLYPILFSLYLSFTTWNGNSPIKFVGLDNFTLLFKDSVFWQSMINGVIVFTLTVPLMLIVSLALAVILNTKRVRGFRIYRVILFMPYITNMVAAGFAFRLLLNQSDGLVNTLLGDVGIGPVPWLESVSGARVSLALLIVWAWLGYNMVIMLAGLQTIPADLTDAARIDGANNAQAFFFVTIPMMRPVITFTVVLSTIGSFGLFTEVYTLTGGGPINATITPIIAIFNQAFGNFRFGYASAMSYIYFAVIFVFTLFQLSYFGKVDEN